uniref:Uncharacterized protein n=1 Tax=Neobodo designis TaxID=312471 RepID=A0A7S1W940_NEODS|mmetsp:Transcript_7644/g.23841  ORF Transcript_7644/g.23841 Transcript_7644/m.23841 type:complete len:225 (+) Transcript_7644:67-741(+)|eukprot:CAMPEP_0174845022 /NCGR_PEP_ID=MMETSP1114-20130205/11472_1 /TAXON_ID=312471 /ORGANISM="Neobodo designis, Strain CCAP 1951/1" /LENGTH=224 /DNA_ID=CAMNT_0016079269 /DNA_START=65 /DNA_END=739 /DNA_ORIENTATION=+
MAPVGGLAIFFGHLAVVVLGLPAFLAAVLNTSAFPPVLPVAVPPAVAGPTAKPFLPNFEGSFAIMLPRGVGIDAAREALLEPSSALAVQRLSHLTDPATFREVSAPHAWEPPATPDDDNRTSVRRFTFEEWVPLLGTFGMAIRVAAVHRVASEPQHTAVVEYHASRGAVLRRARRLFWSAGNHSLVVEELFQGMTSPVWAQAAAARTLAVIQGQMARYEELLCQ